MRIDVILLCLFFLDVLVKPSSCFTNTLQQLQHLKDGQELVSPFKIFKLGFLSPGNSPERRYVGIWYNNYYLNGYDNDKPVWIANRNDPVLNRSGSLTIDSDGKFKILRSVMDPIELSSVRTASNVTATLLDSGNLVLQDMNPDGSVRRLLWQSFDYPTDTLLPGMKLGINHKTGMTRELKSWIGDELPAEGSFSLRMDQIVTNRLIITWLGETYWASGLWVKGFFTLANKKSYGTQRLFNFSYISNQNETYFSYDADTYGDQFPRIRMDISGEISIVTLSYKVVYANCFAYSYDDDRRAGCVDNGPPSCRGDYWYQFNEISQRGFIDSRGYVFNETKKLSTYDCLIKCYRNCSCTAYSSTNSDGTGCETWSDNFKFRKSSSDDARNILGTRHILDLYRAPEKKQVGLVIAASLILTLPLFALFLYLIFKKFRLKGKTQTRDPFSYYTTFDYRIYHSLLSLSGVVTSICTFLNFIWRQVVTKAIHTIFSTLTFIWTRLQALRANTATEQDAILYELGIDTRRRRRRNIKKGHDLQFLTFEAVALASENFSDSNKLGEGGFGSVYKGKLMDGQEVAIKRLSKSSGQGLVEFKNEATLIAKLQHTNLVTLVGCCIDKEEKILVYEYLPNKSLDFFLFDTLKRNLLDWKTRFSIIEGIIQGLLYLHKYSRLRVIHRDIKASNILLDEDMNPKISDFGMARIFGAHESKANTINVAGTYGYISPEYAREGLFSVKSDVYSFGVLLLEIVSGRKNNSFRNSESDGPQNLIAHAWELWREGRDWELIDSTMGDSPGENPEALRCIHVALLCVQGNPTDRPTMLDVVGMIYSEVSSMPSPRLPAFYNVTGGITPEIEIETERTDGEIHSVNRASITEMEAR